MKDGTEEKRGIPILGRPGQERPGAITMSTDIKVHFNTLQIQFQKILDNHAEEIERLTEKAVADFDFEESLRIYVHARIRLSMEEAFREIDVTDKIKLLIWNEIEKRLGRGI